jgi:hypothetical protein
MSEISAEQRQAELLKKALQNVDFGRIAAEDERLTLPNYFVEPQQYARIARGEDWLVLGPKGSGKSAINVKLQAQPPANTLVLDISPDEIGWAEIKRYQDCGISPSQAKKNAWLALFLHHITENIERFTTRAYPSDLLRELLVKSGAPAKAKMTLQEVGLQFRVISAKFGKGENPPGVQFEEAVRSVKDAIRILDEGLEADAKDVRLLVDRLDEHWTAGTQDDLTLEGLLLAAREMASLARNIRVQIFLRSDIWARLNFHDKDKFKANMTEIHWTDDSLQALVAERIRYSAQVTGGDEGILYWAFVQEVEGVMGQAGRRDTFRYIFSVIQRRPRDLLYVCGKAAQFRGPVGRPVSSEQVLRALDDYSRNRLDNILHAETARTVPELAKLVRALFGSRIRVRWITLEQKIKEASEKYAADPKKYLDLLLEYEILGRADNGDEFYSDDPAILDMDTNKDTTFVFHPSLRKSMQLKNVYGKIE